MNQGCENAVGKDFEKHKWGSLTYEEKNRLLFFRQKWLLDIFLERNANSKDQHKKSLSDLTSKTRDIAEARE